MRHLWIGGWILQTKTTDALTLLKITFNVLLIVLAIPLGDSFQQLMNINSQAGYWSNVPITNLMSNLGTFCLVSVLFLIGGWGLFRDTLAEFGVHTVAKFKEAQIIVLLLVLFLLIGMGIVGNYFAQRIDLWSA